MSEAELKSFLEWLVDRRRMHDDMSNAEKQTDAYKLNHDSRALAFLEVYAELKSRLALQRQAALEKPERNA